MDVSERKEAYISHIPYPDFCDLQTCSLVFVSPLG